MSGILINSVINCTVRVNYTHAWGQYVGPICDIFYLVLATLDHLNEVHLPFFQFFLMEIEYFILTFTYYIHDSALISGIT